MKESEATFLTYEKARRRNVFPRFFFWVSVAKAGGSWDEDLRVNLVELHPDADRLPQFPYDDPVKRRLFSGLKGTWATIEAEAERAERVCERLNRSTLAVAAAELERGGIRKLFKQCWDEDEQQYG